MRLIDCCIYNQSYEKDLLWLKLYLESPIVDKFYISDCAYTYRGENKGLTLENIIKNENRFEPFRDKIVVINIEKNLSGVEYKPSLKNIDPPEFANAEWQLRDAPTKHLLENYNDDDRVLVTDIDEIFDFTNKDRIDKVFKQFKSYPQEALQFDRIRYSYDFMHRSWREEGDMISPSYTIGNLKRGEAKLRDKKWIGKLVKVENLPVCIEYCNVFNHNGIVKKFFSSLHTCWSIKNIDISLLTNTWTMTDYQTISFGNRYQWFEKVGLNEKNSPLYVLENLDKLKTNNVPDDYRDNRLRLFHFAANFSENRNIE